MSNNYTKTLINASVNDMSNLDMFEIAVLKINIGDDDGVE